jgi:hypothetical protein
MAQMATDAKTQQGSEKAEPAQKLVISSVMTHAKVLDLVKERNPIIARRGQPKR